MVIGERKLAWNLDCKRHRGCVLKEANLRGLEAGLRVGARLMRLMLSFPRSRLVVSLSLSLSLSLPPVAAID